MVEPLNDDFILRGATPTPTSRVTSLLVNQKELASHQNPPLAGSPVLYDTVTSVGSSGAHAEKLEGLDNSTSESSMYGDARGGRPGSISKPDQSRSNRRRSPRSQSSSRGRHRPPNTRTSSSPSGALGYPTAPVTPTENTHNVTPPPGFQSQTFHYPVMALPYAQRPPSHRQYMMQAQPPINMEHTPPPHFGYTHPFHYPGAPDAGMISHNIHANYQQALRPSGSVYPYQSHSPDVIPGTHNSFSNAVTPPTYPHLNTTPPMHSPGIHPPPGQGGAHSAPYGGSGPFHSLQYPSPMSPTQYAYPPQAFPASPHIYPGQYAPSPYARHFPPPQEQDRQGAWWYVPHSTPNVHSSQYPMTYPVMGHHEVDSPYSAGGPSHSPTASRVYPTASLRPGPQSGASQELRVPSPHVSGSVSPLNMDTMTSPSSEHSPAADRPVMRKSYHPNPPTHRSDWVMWAGNVPSDATHDELWRFFNKTPDESLGAGEKANTGVLSIFLISRSSCAFINFETEQNLHEAIEWFNGKPLRPLDPRCPRLVCRVRRKGDDLKAGVGGQRGTGMHTRWVKEQKRKGPELIDTSETSASDGGLSTTSSDLAPVISSLAISSDEEGRSRRAGRHSSSSGSFASTNSSILSRHFPNRFFILKSLTQFDLDLSVEKGLWATQKHNEGILDQAYRTSQHVYLIFSVNKSGEFYGYARMAGPVRRGEHRVSWATRTGSSGSSRSSLSPATGRVVGHTPEEPASPSRVSQLKGPPKNFFNNTPRLVDESPQPAGSADIRYANEQAGYISDSPRPSSGARPTVQSAPAELGIRAQLTMRTPMVKHSLDNQMPRIAPTILSKDSSLDDFELDPNAPIRAIRSGSGQSHESSGLSRGASVLQAVAEEEEKGEEVVAAATGKQELEGEAAEEAWGESFKVEWLCTDKLPFHKTRHIRNPWNHDREVKVSRDGTEVEPLVGQRLINDWERLVGVQDSSPAKMGEASKRGSRSAPLLVAPVAVKAGKQAGTVGAENIEGWGRGIDEKEVGGVSTSLQPPSPQL